MRRPNAFTLIEMMAAALILALVVAWLTGAVGQMNRFEGDARRRAEAALYADRLLAGLEEDAARGVPLQLGRHEEEEGPFQAEIEVAPLEPALLATLGVASDGVASDGDRRSAPPRGAEEAESLGWLNGASSAAIPPLLQASIRVVGKDGTFELGVSRTTFFLNPAALERLEEAGSDEEPVE